MKKKKKPELKTQIIPDVVHLYDDYGNNIYLHLRASVHWDHSLAGFIKRTQEDSELWESTATANRGEK